MRVRGFLVVATSVLLGCGSSDDAGSGAATPDGGSGFQVDSGVSCPVGTATTISGTVRTPAKSSPDPVYNAVVFVPAGEVEAFPKSVSCERCDALQGSKFVVSALSGPDGAFKLEGAVPVGKDVSLVVQIGRWRRQVTIPEVKPCQDNPLPAELTRLPRNHSEGNIPKTAVVAGSYDPVECVLRKIGVEDTEFIAPDFTAIGGGAGRIHFYKSLNSGIRVGSTVPYGVDTLLKDLSWAKQYDQILLPCDGDPRVPSSTSLKALVDYTNAGGRVFVTHFNHVWMSASSDAGWSGLATWNTKRDEVKNAVGTIDQSFPKGKAMAEWLAHVGASKTKGVIDLVDVHPDLDGAPKAQSWITTKAPDSVQHFTFGTPVEKPAAEQCGRVVFSDFHVVTSGDPGAFTFPAECTDGPLTPQERVIEFMLFDLASCVQPDDEAPKPPK